MSPLLVVLLVVAYLLVAVWVGRRYYLWLRYAGPDVWNGQELDVLFNGLLWPMSVPVGTIMSLGNAHPIRWWGRP